MNRWRVGEDRGSKETGGCPLTAVSFQLCQCNVTTPSRRYYNRFCSIPLNDRESKYSQLKLESTASIMRFTPYASISLESRI
jgi:hypothetical protein